MTQQPEGLLRSTDSFASREVSDRFLTSTTVSIVASTASYSLPATFGHAVLVELTANGAKTYLTSYDHVDHPALTSPDVISSGIPRGYKITASSITFAPTPGSSQTATLLVCAYRHAAGWHGGPAYRNGRAFDDYAVLYAVGWLARKDKAWDLSNSCEQGMAGVARDLNGSCDTATRTARTAFATWERPEARHSWEPVLVAYKTLQIEPSRATVLPGALVRREQTSVADHATPEAAKQVTDALSQRVRDLSASVGLFNAASYS